MTWKHIHTSDTDYYYWQLHRLMTFVDSTLPISLSKHPPTLWGASHCDRSLVCVSVFVCALGQKMLTALVDAVCTLMWTGWPCVWPPTSSLTRPAHHLGDLGLSRWVCPELDGSMMLSFSVQFHQWLLVSVSLFESYQIGFKCSLDLASFLFISSSPLLLLTPIFLGHSI